MREDSGSLIADIGLHEYESKRSIQPRECHNIHAHASGLGDGFHSLANTTQVIHGAIAGGKRKEPAFRRTWYTTTRYVFFTNMDCLFFGWCKPRLIECGQDIWLAERYSRCNRRRLIISSLSRTYLRPRSCYYRSATLAQTLCSMTGMTTRYLGVVVVVFLVWCW